MDLENMWSSAIEEFNGSEKVGLSAAEKLNGSGKPGGAGKVEVQVLNLM